MTWPMIPLTESLVDATGGNSKIQRRDYLQSGSLAVIDQGQNAIAGYTNETEAAYQGSLPVVLFGDHTRAVKYVDHPFALGADGVKVLAPRNGFSAKFLHYYLLSRDIPSRGYSRHFKFLKELEVPVVAPSEQRRIVEILDEADRLRQLRLQADAKAGNILPALFRYFFGQPNEWKNAEPLGQLVTVKSGGTPSKSVPEFWRGITPWVSPKDMKLDEIEDAEDHVSDSAIAQAAVQLLPVDSILVVVRGMILARDVPVAIARRPVTINQDMKALVLNDQRLNPLYLFAAVKTQAARLLAEVTTAAHGTKKLETSRLTNLPISIPSPSELHSFSSAYDQLLAVDRLRAAAGQRVDQLFSLLLRRAFFGQLTAKWRESHMKELLVEMEQQARLLNLPLPLEATA